MTDHKGKNWHNIGEESHTLCMATQGVTPEGKVFPVRCKQWHCPVCAPINAQYCAIKTANGVYALMAAGIMPRFATITQSGKVRTPRFAYSILASQWSGFRNRWEYWARKQGIPNPYAAFVEGQSRRAGMPHFHILAAGLPDKEKLQEMVVSSGFGYQVDLQRIKPNAGAAWYVSKYSTKSSDAQFMPRGFRRVRYSEDWPNMLFRADLLEGASIIREPRESYAHWIVRAVQAFGVDPQSVMLQTQELVDQTGNLEASDYAARALLLVEGW